MKEKLGLCLTSCSHHTSFLSRQRDIIASFFVWCLYCVDRFLRNSQKFDIWLLHYKFDDQHSELVSPVGVSDPDKLSDKDTPEDEELDQELSEEASYQETMRGVRSFMGWHQIPDFDSSSSSLDDNPFAGVRTQPTGKVSINCR